ncbi:MAG: PilZ domain-containing protein, partial [Proteobacteria bacterium]|nr:PilZ domain-containing protein [Pseudomonadota bacterium]
MNNNETFIERRKHKRHRLKEGAFVATAGNLGQILDISEVGLAFSYVNLDDQTNDTGELDIIFNGSDLLNNLPYKAVSEKVTESKFSRHPIVIKRCGLLFRELSSAQKAELETFI